MSDVNFLLEERTCPNCEGVMYAESDDRYCLECIHEGWV